MCIQSVRVLQRSRTRLLAHVTAGLASLKSTGLASRLGTQAGVDSTVLRQNFFFPLWET